MEHFSDKELYIKIKEGNQDAFEFVFLRYYGDLCSYAQSIIHHKESSEEIVQDVFVKLWELRETLDVNTSLKSYLYRTVHNFCLNKIDHWKVRDNYSKKVISEYNPDALQFVPFSDDYPIANLIVKELEEKIKDSISALPEHCRDIFLLIRMKGLSYQEAANKLNISVNTVKTQMHRAVIKLKEMLQEYLPIIWIFSFIFFRSE
jgi:RNA polymerase sigma-70 factor, ECF subfamily